VGRFSKKSDVVKAMVSGINFVMIPPPRPPSRIGNEVVFAPPVNVSETAVRRGHIRDEIWSVVHRDPQWGWYVYTSQLIEWERPHEGYSTRITYYYQPENLGRWLFGGQYSIEDTPEVINEHLRATLAKGWKSTLPNGPL
jgi:hypothetical protein